jgi:ABC-type polysaccharide/polyol phosphate transport system ATPase subunit
MTTPIVMGVSNVFKKFRRGEFHDSLRDLIPALARRALSRVGGVPALEGGEFWALRDVSFDVRRGEAVAVIGHNGAGKSTLLKHLTGLLKPTQGRIDVNGRLSALIEVGAGFHHDLTGRENVFLNGVILGMSRAEIRSKFDEIVDFSGLHEFIDTPVKRYSSGMFAKLGFSVAAHMEPDILIVDEVLSVGDYSFQTKGVEKMRSVVNGGATVVFVSHNMKAVRDLCPRSILLKNGTLVEDGPTSNVLRTYMEQARASTSAQEASEVRLVAARMRAVEGERLDFEAGEAADLELEIEGGTGASGVGILVSILNEYLWEAFIITSQWLGLGPLDIKPGERRTIRIRLNLHLAPGTFHVSVTLRRFDLSKVFHRVEAATTFVVTSSQEVGGIVHLHPRLLDA